MPILRRELFIKRTKPPCLRGDDRFSVCAMAGKGACGEGAEADRRRKRGSEPVLSLSHVVSCLPARVVRTALILTLPLSPLWTRRTYACSHPLNFFPGVIPIFYL